MRYLLILLFVFLTACGSTVPVLKPYKMDIQQGNVVTSKMLLQLRPGMTKSQVRFIMGTPLVVDSFHENRWDYFYQMRQGGKVIEQRRVILEFEKDLLTRVRGDVVPQGTAGADTGEAPASKTIVVPAKKAEEKSWTEKLKFWKKDETPTTKPLETAPMEAPKTVVPEAATPETAEPESTGTEDTPSVLAVPIGAGASTESPKVEAPQVETPAEPTQPETSPVEVNKLKAPEPEPAKAEAAPTPVEAPESTPEPAKIAPPEVSPVVPVAPKVPSGQQDEKMIFRMDHTLDQNTLEQEMAPKATEVEKPAEKVVKPKKKVDDTPLPPETEPTFFDRMLEKIGF